MLGQGGLNLTEFDAQAADLDLGVDPANELEVAVRSITRQIAGPVKPCPGLRAERIGYEALRGQLRPVQVATGQADAGDKNFARDSYRHGL